MEFATNFFLVISGLAVAIWLMFWTMIRWKRRIYNQNQTWYSPVWWTLLSLSLASFLIAVTLFYLR